MQVSSVTLKCHVDTVLIRPKAKRERMDFHHRGSTRHITAQKQKSMSPLRYSNAHTGPLRES